MRSLKRPTLAAWAVNQLARQQADKVSRLANLVGSIANERSAPRLREIGRSRHDLIAELLDDADEVLRAAGRSSSAKTRQEVADTLMSATSEGDLRALVTGTFTRPLESSGFGPTMSVDPPADLPDADERLRAELAKLHDEMRRREQERAGASKRAIQARAALTESENELAATERAIARLEDKIESLEHKLTR